MSRNALNLNFNKLQYEDFTSCIFTFIHRSVSKYTSSSAINTLLAAHLSFAWPLSVGFCSICPLAISPHCDSSSSGLGMLEVVTAVGGLQQRIR